MTDPAQQPDLRSLEDKLTQRATNEREQPFKDELRQRLLNTAAAMPHTPPRRRSLRIGGYLSSPRRARIALATVTVAALALTGVLSLTSLTSQGPLSGPGSASAQIILHRVAATTLAPGQAAHFAYTITLTASKPTINASGTIDLWYEITADGASRSLQTLTLSKAPGLPAQLYGRYLQLGDQLYAYDAERNLILLPSERNDISVIVLPNAAFDGATLARTLEPLAAGGKARLLPRQTLNGTPVDPVQVDGALDEPGLRATFYFDAQSHLLRGFDATSIDPSYPTPSWHIRLTTTSATPAGSVPAGAFDLAAPTTTPIEPPPLNKQTLFAVCSHRLTQQTKPATILAACQTANPHLTPTQILNALTQDTKTQLDTALHAGLITTNQANTALTAAQAQIQNTTLTPRTH
jgi:hypothetical protein